MDKLYELTAYNLLIQHVDRQESPGPSRRFDRGTQFRIVRQRHRWGASNLDYYTIEITGEHYNIVAKALENFTREIVITRVPLNAGI